MVAMIAPNVFISKGYENEPALKFSEKGDCVQFNIGWKVYDPKAEGDSRWINLHVKAFGQVSTRIKNMNVKEKSCVNLYGRLDEESWIDKNSGETKKRFIMILDNIEFAYNGSKSKDSNANGTPAQNNNGQYAPGMGQIPQGQAMQQMSAQGQYVPQGYAPQPQAAPQGYVNQSGQQVSQQQARTTPQSVPQPIGNAAGFAGFTGFQPYEGGNMFPV